MKALLSVIMGAAIMISGLFIGLDGWRLLGYFFMLLTAITIAKEWENKKEERQC